MPSTFVVKGASETEYTFEKLGTNAYCRIEELTGEHLGPILDELRGENSRVSLLRKFVKGMLVAPKDATLDQVGDIIDDLGGPALMRLALFSTPVKAVETPELVAA